MGGRREWMVLLAVAAVAGAWGCAGGGGPGDTGSDGGADPVADAPDVPGDAADAVADLPGDGGSGDAPGDAADAPGDLPADAPADLPGDLPGDVPPPWSWAGSDPFPLDGAFFAAHPQAFRRMSRYATRVAGPPAGRPDVGHRGSFGAGNGQVFAFVGLADPLNTLHTLVGPTYERRSDFFGDWAVRLVRAVDSSVPDFDEEWAGRSLSAPVVVTRGRLGDLDLDTIDVAPPPGSAVVPSGCWLRGLVVRNRGAAASPPLELVAVPTNPVAAPDGTTLVELQKPLDGKVRRVAVRFAGADREASVAGDGRLRLPLGPLDPGAESLHLLTFCTDAVDFGNEDAPVAGSSSGPDQVLPAVLDAVAAAYGAWEGATLQMDLPDPMVADFLDGMKMTLKVQTSEHGATCPMSEYTRTWARDNVGPVMAMLAYGAFGDVGAMLDYVEAAIRRTGDLQNSYDADLDPATAPPAPEWSTLGPLGQRVAGETPSYMVRMYGLHHRYTGDAARADARWGLLERCLFAQGFGPDDLLPFTGDETYRAAMNAALGLGLEVAHQDLSWSANSTFLWLGAAREYAALAEATGRPGEAQRARDRAASMEATALPHYVRGDGCVSSFVDKETLEPADPFEDVALQVLWSGWKDGDDAFAAKSLQCLGERLRRAPGEWVSRPAPEYEGIFGAWEGVYTGMLPGYVLADLADAGHPEAQAAFHAVRLSLDTSGNLQEYLIFDDHSGLSVAYDPTGVLGDYTAKFRPWEGGIVAEAALRYLLGAAPDAPARRLALRPHLPDGWPRMAFRGVRAGDERFDVEVARDAGGTVTVSVERAGMGGLGRRAEASSWDVSLRWDGPDGTRAWTVDGQAVPAGDVARRVNLFGVATDDLPAVPLAPGGSVAWTVADVP